MQVSRPYSMVGVSFARLHREVTTDRCWLPKATRTQHRPRVALYREKVDSKNCVEPEQALGSRRERAIRLNGEGLCMAAT